MVVSGLMRLAAAYMALVALAVAVHFLATPLYDPTVEGTANTIWNILDICMIAAVALAVIAGFARVRMVHSRTDAKEFIAANVHFYAAAALLLILLWNWFDFKWGNGGDAQIWVVIDVGVPLLLGSTAVYMFREA